MAIPGRKLPQEIVKAIRRLKRAGLSLRQIAATLGVSTRTVGRVLGSKE